jgi:hypothetical protein
MQESPFHLSKTTNKHLGERVLFQQRGKVLVEHGFGRIEA